MRHLFRSFAERYWNLSLRRKLVWLLLIVLLVASVLSYGVYRQVYRRALNQRILEGSEQFGRSVAALIQTELENENRYSKMVLANPLVQEALTHKAGRDALQVKHVNAYLSSVLSDDKLASAIYLLDEAGNLYGADRNGLRKPAFDTRNLQETRLYQMALKADGATIYVHQTEAWSWGREEQAFTMCRIVKNLDTFRPIGLLVFHIPFAQLSEMARNLAGRSRVDFSIHTPDGAGIYTHLHPDLEQTGKDDGGTVNYIKTESRMEKPAWILYCYYPVREVQEGFRDFFFMGLTLIAVSAVLVFFGAQLVSASVSRPLKQLTRSMQEVEQGQFREAHIAKGRDEIGLVQKRYNIMVKRIHELIRDVRRTERTKRLADLKLLQAQIKPHFLYNTLETIKGLCYSGRSMRAYFVAQSLGDFYRLSLSKGADVIPLRDEIANVKSYLRIQHQRYPRIFRVSYAIDPQVLDYPVLKLMLQPFVENALYHGIKPKGEAGVILISARRRAEDLELMVADDGVGMDLSKMHFGEEGHLEGFGISGSIRRIELFYQAKNLVQMESIPGVGTSVCIHLPLCPPDPDELADDAANFDERRA